MIPQIVYGCMCGTMLYLETQVIRRGDYLVSYYAARGFLPAQLLLLIAFPLIAFKYLNNVCFSTVPNSRKEKEDLFVTLPGAILANVFSLIHYKVLHFAGVGLWLYGLQVLAVLRQRRVDRYEHRFCRLERLVLLYQGVLSCGFGISYVLKYKAVTQLIQFAIILLYSLWYGKDIMQVGSGFRSTLLTEDSIKRACFVLTRQKGPSKGSNTLKQDSLL